MVYDSINKIDRRGIGFAIALFSGFFGFSYVISDVGLDVNTLIDRFNDYNNLTSSDFNIIIKDYLRFRIPDILEPLIRFIVSRLTDDYRFFLSALGLVFGILYGKNIKELLDWGSYCFNLSGILFLIGTIIVISPNNGVNQFRFWTATMLFFYGVFRFIRTQNSKNLLISGLAIFSHIGLLVFLVPMIIWYFFRNNSKLFIIIMPISFLLRGIDLIYFENYVSFFGEALTNKFNLYTSDYAFEIAAARDELNWYAVWWRPLIIYSGSLTMILIYFNHLRLLTFPLIQYFNFILFLISLTNFYSFFPLIFRYETIVAYGIMSFLYLYNSEVINSVKERIILLNYLPVLLLISINMKSLLQATNAYIFISNPILQLFIDNEISLFDLFI